MTKFEIRKDTFYGKIDVLYNKAGSLEYINFGDAEMADELRQSYKKFLPVRVEGLDEFGKNIGATITKVSIVVTFEGWYTCFNVKRNKDKALKIWEKMTPEERVMCQYGTKKYLAYCRRNQWYTQMYPDTFLRNRHWLDEWDKI